VTEVRETSYAQFDEATPKFFEQSNKPSWGTGFWRVPIKNCAAVRLFGRSLLISDAVGLVIDTIVSE
jgi:hypothetical protein